MKKILLIALLAVVPLTAGAFRIEWENSTVAQLIADSEANKPIPLVRGSSWNMREAWIGVLEEQANLLLGQAKKLRAMNASEMSAGSCLDLKNNLVIGSTDAKTNGEVSKLQLFLKAKGFFPDAQGTGYYGQKTAEAVVRFQKSVGMDFVTTKSGVGKMTRAKIKEQCGSQSAVREVSWNIEMAYPNMTDVNDNRKYEQAISINVISADGSTKRYSLGNAYGCSVSTTLPTLSGKEMLGHVNCYFALTGVAFLAYRQNGQFIVEKYQDDASGITDGKTTILLQL